MMDNHLSKGHLTTAAPPHEVDLLLLAEATFNDGESSFKKTPGNSCKPPHEVDLILPAPATFHGGEPSFKRTPANSGKTP